MRSGIVKESLLVMSKSYEVWDSNAGQLSVRKLLDKKSIIGIADVWTDGLTPTCLDELRSCYWESVSVQRSGLVIDKMLGNFLRLGAVLPLPIIDVRYELLVGQSGQTHAALDDFLANCPDSVSRMS